MLTIEEINEKYRDMTRQEFAYGLHKLGNLMHDARFLSPCLSNRYTFSDTLPSSCDTLDTLEKMTRFAEAFKGIFTWQYAEKYNTIHYVVELTLSDRFIYRLVHIVALEEHIR